MVTGLHPDTGYVVSVFSSNSKGKSDRMNLQAFTLKSSELFETSESALTNMDGFQLTPILGVLLIVGGAMTIVFLAISAYFCVRKNSDPGSTSSGGSGDQNQGNAPPPSSRLAKNATTVNGNAKVTPPSSDQNHRLPQPPTDNGHSSFSVGYTVTNGSDGRVVITDSNNLDLNCGPDVVPSHGN